MILAEFLCAITFSLLSLVTFFFLHQLNTKPARRNLQANLSFSHHASIDQVRSAKPSSSRASCQSWPGKQDRERFNAIYVERPHIILHLFRPSEYMCQGFFAGLRSVLICHTVMEVRSLILT